MAAASANFHYHCNGITAAARMNLFIAPDQAMALVVELPAFGAKVPSAKLVHTSGETPRALLVFS